MGKYNRATVVFIMGAIGAVNAIWPGAVGLDETTVTVLVALALPIVAHFIPGGKA